MHRRLQRLPLHRVPRRLPRCLIASVGLGALLLAAGCGSSSAAPTTTAKASATTVASAGATTATSSLTGATGVATSAEEKAFCAEYNRLIGELTASATSGAGADGLVTWYGANRDKVVANAAAAPAGVKPAYTAFLAVVDDAIATKDLSKAFASVDVTKARKELDTFCYGVR